MKWVKKKNSLMQYSESPAFYGSTNKPKATKRHISLSEMEIENTRMPLKIITP